MKIFYLILSALIGCTCVNAASEQVFKVNNTLAQMDVEREVDQYVTILDQLAEDIKNGGMVFKYNGTNVSDRGFTIVKPQIYIRKEIFEKYKKYAHVIQRKTIWNEIANRYYNQDHDYGGGIFTGQACMDLKSKLLLKIELLDVNGKVISSQSPCFYDQLFRYRVFLNYMSDHENFSDYYLSMGGDSVFRLPLAEIKRIDSIRFSINDNPNFGKLY